MGRNSSVKIQIHQLNITYYAPTLITLVWRYYFHTGDTKQWYFYAYGNKHNLHHILPHILLVQFVNIRTGMWWVKFLHLLLPEEHTTEMISTYNPLYLKQLMSHKSFGLNVDAVAAHVWSHIFIP